MTQKKLDINMSRRVKVNNRDISYLEFVCRYSNSTPETIKQLIEISNIDQETNMPDIMFKILRKGYFEIADILIEKGFDIKKTYNGFTLLHYLFRIQNFNIEIESAKNYLINKGLKLTDKNPLGQDCLMLACQQDPPNMPLISLLLKQKEDIDIHTKDNDNNTCLHHICEMKNPHLGLIQLLVEHGINVRAINSNGNSCLHQFLKNKNLTLNKIKLLLDNGANPNIKPNSNESVLVSACLREEFAIVKLLLEYDADLNEINLDKQKLILQTLHVKAMNPLALFLLITLKDLRGIELSTMHTEITLESLWHHLINENIALPEIQTIIRQTIIENIKPDSISINHMSKKDNHRLTTWFLSAKEIEKKLAFKFPNPLKKIIGFESCDDKDLVLNFLIYEPKTEVAKVLKSIFQQITNLINIRSTYTRSSSFFS